MTERKLRELVERRRRVEFWGRTHYITPRLCASVFGDGKALVYWAQFDHRPNYYVVRIDSSWRVENREDGPDDIREHLEDIEDALVEQFGYDTDDDTPDRPMSRRYPRWFPCVARESCGCHWGRIRHREIPWPTKVRRQ